MIFVCCGTQIYQFDRLLIELDKIVKEGLIKETIFAQVGTLNYVPKYFDYKQFVSHDEFDKLRKEATLIISHGGTGALIGASKIGKNIIAVPRLSAYGEHLDDHQLQIVTVLEKEGYIRAVYDITKLQNTIIDALKNPISKPYKRESNVLNIINSYIDMWFGGSNNEN